MWRLQEFNLPEETCIHPCTHMRVHSSTPALGACFRKIGLHPDTQRGSRDYILGVIGSDQPRNWEVNAILSLLSVYQQIKKPSAKSIHVGNQMCKFRVGTFLIPFPLIWQQRYEEFVRYKTWDSVFLRACLARINHEKDCEVEWLL